MPCAAPGWTARRFCKSGGNCRSRRALQLLKPKAPVAISFTAPVARPRRQVGGSSAYATPALRTLSTTPIHGTHTRAFHSTPEHFTRKEDDAQEDEDDFMQAYEDMLLNASANAPEEGTEAGPAAAEVTEAFTATSQSKRETTSADALVRDAMALLPVDGSATPLTELTPLLDLEAISERFGSARGFFQLYPHLFTCVQDDKTRRWCVARVSAASAAAAVAEGGGFVKPHSLSPSERHTEFDVAAAAQHRELDVSELALKDELKQLQKDLCFTATSTSLSPAQSSTRASKKTFTSSKATHRCVQAVKEAAAALDWAAVAALLPKDGTPLSIAQLRAQLPSDIRDTLLLHRTGLARSFKHDYAKAHAFVQLTADGASFLRTSASRRSTTASEAAEAPTAPTASQMSCPTSTPALWTPRAAAPTAVVTLTSAAHRRTELQSGNTTGTVELDDGVYVPVPRDAAEAYLKDTAEAWWVDLPLEETEDGSTTVEGEGHARAELLVGEAEDAAAGALDPLTGLSEVPYDGLDAPRRRDSTGTSLLSSARAGFDDPALLAGFDLDLLRHAPAAPAPPERKSKLPPPTATESGGPQTTKKTAEAPRKRTPRPTSLEEWIDLHTALAHAHGWLTPPEMLSYLVECVPTFFIPLDEVRTSDALLKIIGPRTTMRTLLTRIYTYYVELSEDKAQVRLAATVVHPQRGVADQHYPAWASARAAATVQEDRNRKGTAMDWLSPEALAERQAADLQDARRPAAVAAADAASTATTTAPTRSKLRASEATKAFPVLRVLRPIKSALPSHLPRKKPQSGRAAMERPPPPLPPSSSSLPPAPDSTAATAVPPSTQSLTADAAPKHTQPLTMKNLTAASAAALLSKPAKALDQSAKENTETIIINSSRTLFNGHSSAEGNARTASARVSLSSVPMTDIGYPFVALSTQPVEEWPWWARVLCVLPHDTYTPLADFCAQFTPPLTPSELNLLWSATDSVKSSSSSASTRDGSSKHAPHPFPFALLRAPLEEEKRVRLRPFWLAPGCTAELDATALSAEVTKQLRPVWRTVPRVLQKLNPEARDALMNFAQRRMLGPACSAELALVCLLRDCGRVCWVTEDGTKVRRYAAAQEMDDVFHLGLSFLYGFASARGWLSVTEVLAKAAQHVEPLFKAENAGTALRSPYEVGLLGMLHRTPTAELQAFLQRHTQWLDVKRVEGPPGTVSEGEAGSTLLVRRRSAFVSFTR